MCRCSRPRAHAASRSGSPIRRRLPTTQRSRYSPSRVSAMVEVEVTRDGGVQTITLNRPDVLNAFNRALHRALRDALKDARDPDVRAVVITGAGRGFSAGQDLKEFGESPDVAETL